MRQYILHVISKQLRRMSKNKLVSQSVLEKFKNALSVNIKDKLPYSEDFQKYFLSQKRREKLLNKDQLRFSSFLESGNLDRVEAFPMARANMLLEMKSMMTPG